MRQKSNFEGQVGPTWRQHGPTWRQHGASWPQLGRTCLQLGPTWGPILAHLGLSWLILALCWPQDRPRWPQDAPSCLKLASSWLKLSSTWANLGQLGPQIFDFSLIFRVMLASKIVNKSIFIKKVKNLKICFSPKRRHYFSGSEASKNHEKLIPNRLKNR